MKKILLFSTVLSSILLFASCKNATTESASSKDSSNMVASSTFDMGSVKTTLEEENRKFMDEVKKGDSTALAAHYASDAQMLPPNSDPIKKADIASAWGSFSRMGMKELKVNTTDLAGGQDLLAETGTYELMGADNKMMDKGKYLVVWKKENGAWKIYRDIFNTSMPMPAK
jgi:ketosteroid isomerase-like protein